MVFYNTLNQKLGHATVQLEDDLPHGGCLLRCPCGEVFEMQSNFTTSPVKHTPENCPHCGGDIVFPNADW